MRRTMLTVVPVALGLGLCCVACKPVATASEPTRTTSAAVTTVSPPDDTTVTSEPPVTWCGVDTVTTRPLTSADVVVDLLACGPGDRVIAWLPGEREEAEAALRTPGVPSESFVGITCAGPQLPDLSFVARLGDGTAIGTEVPVAYGPCPVPVPAAGELIDRLVSRSGA